MTETCKVYAVRVNAHPDKPRQSWHHFLSKAERDLTAKAMRHEYAGTIFEQEFEVEVSPQSIVRLLDKYRS